MILFSLSFLLVFVSSYLLTSVLAPRKSVLGLIYLFVIAFAQIVFTFEVLSLFTAIKQFWVLGFNVIFLLVSIYIFKRISPDFWGMDCESFKNRFVNSLKLDKSLIWLTFAFLTFIITASILCTLMPITSADAQGYHVARSLFWALQGSLGHFETSDVRNLSFPINSEILYTWVILFVKKDVFLGFFSFVGYLLTIVSMYNILGFLGYCTRKKLWVVFLLSSLPCVLVQASGTETDIIIAGLISSSIFLFWYALKHNKLTPIFMSSLAYALAIGTKTPAIIAVPAVGLLFFILSFYYKNFKLLAFFLGFSVLNFIIFASYNYISNLIYFSNVTGPQSILIVTKNYYGLKGMFANLIKYFYMFFDFTGFTWSKYLGPHIAHLRELSLEYFNLNYVSDGQYSTDFYVNNLLLEPLMGAGILGFLVFLPSMFWAFISPVFKPKSLKARFMSLFSILFLVNILVISYLLAYMTFNVRFVMFFIALSSPVLVYSYFKKRNPLKYVIVFFSFFSLFFVSTHLWARPFVKICKDLMLKPSITALRERALCMDFDQVPAYSNSACVLRNKIRSTFSNKNKILAFFTTSDNIYTFKTLEYEGYQVDFRRMEDIANVDVDKYNIVIANDNGQVATYIQDYETRKDEFYKSVNGKIIFKTGPEVPCFYRKNKYVANVLDEKTSYPYQVQCAMTGTYLQKHHLKEIGISGVIRPFLNEYNYYIIYRNTSLPLWPQKAHIKD